MSLPKRALGSSGVEVTTVGFGAWAIGGGGWTYSWAREAAKPLIAPTGDPRRL
jgi:aryl-alcohol dehydrogenase-like predicted oxidoreductase